MIEKKYFTVAIATINGAGSILGFSGLVGMSFNFYYD